MVISHRAPSLKSFRWLWQPIRKISDDPRIVIGPKSGELWKSMEKDKSGAKKPGKAAPAMKSPTKQGSGIPGYLQQKKRGEEARASREEKKQKAKVAAEAKVAMEEEILKKPEDVHDKLDAAQQVRGSDCFD